ncbi:MULTISPECIES: pirin family protein [Geobacillus]|uniref:Pirin family protein n=1 Tax=Geobacillus zalihae TaxID=213419 RepID=A0A1V9CFR9_9BACL|nr:MULTISPECIES: pirin family protein [Geobacillus]OQP17229.1 pirin family protein [Geobacillus zalihae]OQP20466.1 pirin family protein [Geobacillus zalihae]QNU17087.1 pirin family protein [Geobacillus zalihae]QNU26237.1 pirin family protein [Geobacillus zalihae]RXS85105.1 pirin family protein [Geobacillus sp. PK12]
MIRIDRASSRYHADYGWLKTYHSFSFGEYYDPNNIQFGPLRVLNDDFVAPLAGFGAHPHREMEIVSIVLKGYLQHEDSTGHKAVTTFGGVQRMSAGTGIVHSEVNPSATEEVNFLQLWFLPEQYGLPPSYERTEFPVDKMKNALLPIVTKHPSSPGIAHIHQDLTIYLSDLEAGHELTFTQPEGRNIFVFVIEGDLTLNGEAHLERRDAARITDTPALRLATNEGSRLMLIDLPKEG